MLVSSKGRMRLLQSLDGISIIPTSTKATSQETLRNKKPEYSIKLVRSPIFIAFNCTYLLVGGK